MNFQDKILEWVNQNKKFQESKEAERRIAICKICPNHLIAVGIWCKLCGCNMYLKTHLFSMHCPDNPQRW